MSKNQLDLKDYMVSKDKDQNIFLSVVIPAYNEERRLPSSLIPTIEFLKKQPYLSEIIVVSDGSTDNTKGIAESFLKEFSALRVIGYFPNRGKGYAVKTGMLAAKGKYRLFMDADYAVPIQFLSAFLSMINHNYDLVIASRGLRQSQIEVHQSFFRELVAKIFGEIQRFVLRLPSFDTSCGFKLFTKEAAEILFPQLKFDCAYFDAELLFVAYQSKMQVGEIGVRWRHDGETRLPIGIIRAFDIIKKMLMMRQLHRNLNRWMQNSLCKNINLIEWPFLPGIKERPFWMGDGFLVGDRKLHILQYGLNQDGWDNELTIMLENTVDSDHFMNQASRGNAIRGVINELKADKPVIIDIGCYSGKFLAMLRNHYKDGLIIGADAFPEKLLELSNIYPDMPFLQFDLTQCPLPNNSVDAVVLLNVLEHIKDDESAMRHVFRIIRPGGIAMIEVPCNPGLFDIYDEVLKHYRRYYLRDIVRLTEKSGFKVIKASHLGFFLYPFFRFIKLHNRKRAFKLSNEQKTLFVKKAITESELKGGVIGNIALRFEALLGRIFSYPVGIRCVLILKKI